MVAVMTVTPGPDTALVIRNTLRRGTRHGVLTAIGCTSGLVVWGALSSIGLATALEAMPVFFRLVRLVGGVYLLWLGIALLRSGGLVLRTNSRPLNDEQREDLRSFRTGLLVDLLNPKAAVFFMVLLPGFVAESEAVVATTALLSAIAVGAAAVGLSAYACVATVGVARLSPSTRQTAEWATAAVLLALGIRMLYEDLR